MIVVNPSTRQFNIPGADLVFGVTADSGSVTKEFSCPRYVGNGLDLTGCFIRMNYRNGNGEIDSYLVKNVTVDGDNVVFGWELSPKVTMYKGNVSFVMCVVGPDTKVAWHTTLGRGQVLEGLEPDSAMIEEGTADVVAALVAMVEAQTEVVADKGAEWVRNVQSEGTDQIVAVQTAGRESREAAVAEIEAKGVNVRESIPDDYTALSEAVDGLVRGRAGAIVCEAAGSAVVVNDASDLPMQGMKIFGRSTQDGTPTPDAPVEIVSVVEPVVTVCGKNLLNVKNSGSKIGVTETVTNGRVTFSGTAEGSGGRTAWKRSDVVTLPPGTYRMSMTVPKGKAPQPCLTINGTTTVLASDTNSFTVTEPTPAYLGFNYDAGVSYDAENVAVQLEVGKIPTDYEPHSSQTLELTHTLPGIPVTSGGNYTDSDGQQWICDEVDLERGVYVQRVGVRVFTGTTETWKDGTISASGQHYVYLADANVTVLNGSVCSHGVSNYSGSWNTGSYWRSGTGLFQVFCDMSLSEWKDYLATQNNAGTPVSLQFVMDAPIETPLSETEIAAYRALHSNYPNTTVLNDAGAHMVVKYAADTKLYIDNKIAALIGG